MRDPVHVVGLCGSTRDDSTTRVALERALDAAVAAGATTDLIDLRELDLPVFDPDAPAPEAAERLGARLRRADAVVLGTPMYHGSYASPLKTALDYCGFDEFDGTTVGLLAVAGGAFPTQALAHLRAVCRALSAWTLPHEVAIPNAAETVADGEVVEEAIRDRIDALGERLVAYAGVERFPNVDPARSAGETGAPAVD